MDNTSSSLINFTHSSPPPAVATTADYDYADYSGDHGTFSPCQYSLHGASFLPPLYCVFFAVGLPGNALVLWVIVCGVRLRSMSDVCLLNLALADLLLVCSLPFLAHQARDQWTLGEAACRAVLGAYHLGFYAGIFLVLLMSVDRYLAVVGGPPHLHMLPRERTRSLGVAGAAAAWAAGLLASFPEMAFLHVQEAEASESSSPSGRVLFCAPQFETTATTHNNSVTSNSHFWTVFGLFKMNVLGLLLPMTVMVFCYSRIVHRLLSHSHSLAVRQSVRLVLVVVAVFFLCWAPYNVAALLKALELLGVYQGGCQGSRAVRLALQLSEAAAYAHSVLNPLLYVFVGRKFRGHLVRMLGGAPCWRPCCRGAAGTCGSMGTCGTDGTLSELDRVTVSAVSQQQQQQQQQRPSSTVDEKSTAL